MYKNGLIRKVRLILKFVTSQPGQQTIAINILANISRRKNNQKMKLSQLIECNMRTVFLEKSFSKCGEETISRPFSKKSKLSISLDKYSKAVYGSLLLHANLRAVEI